MTFVTIPALIGPMLGPFLGGLIVGYFHWRVIFFVNIPIGILGLYLVYKHLPDYRSESTPPLDFIGLVLFGSGIALLSYVLEVFGEHSLSGREILGLLAIALLLLTAYGWHAVHAEFPLLRMTLLRIRTFRAAVIGGFITRIGIGGIPFLWPLLYQVGLGFTPIQSGLLMMPQAVAAMTLKLVVTRILTRFGYRGILISNTVILGLLIMVFATIGLGTPVWLIVAQAFVYGFFASLQYSGMNTLVYADVTEEEASAASTIASTLQQMSISFGVASASLATAIFIPDRFSTSGPEMIRGIHRAFLVLGAMTVLSSIIFRELKRGDGGDRSVRDAKGRTPADAARARGLDEAAEARNFRPDQRHRQHHHHRGHAARDRRKDGTEILAHDVRFKPAQLVGGADEQIID